MLLTGAAFFITALIYASVGFGGGSTYNAILVLADANYALIPLLALSCNIIVVSGGLRQFRREGHIELRAALPWIIASVPAAFIGGLIPLPKIYFTGLLGAALLLSAAKLLSSGTARQMPPAANHRFTPYFAGASLGLLAGLTGIGGGIFLAPILYFLNWGNAKQIASCCSLFILVNSLAGGLGQIVKAAETGSLISALAYWPIWPAVFIGGQIGSRLGASYLKMAAVKKLTAILVLYAGLRLLLKFYSLALAG